MSKDKSQPAAPKAKTSHHKREILTAASGTGSVDLVWPRASISNAKITDGVGQLAIEGVGNQCRLMVTGGVLDGKVTVEWDETR